MVEITYKCTDCDFTFIDKNLIFYLDTIDSNSKDISDKNNKSETKSADSNNIEDLEDLLNEDINNLELFESSLNKEISDKMTKSLISGFLYENYCPNCNELIKTYVPEDNKLFTREEIERIMHKVISKRENMPKTNFKILFFDFKNTFYRDRRNILENNECPNCKSEMSLVISEKIPCPKCGKKLKEEF